MVEIKIKKLSDEAIIPTLGSKEAAGFDLYSCVDTTIEPGKTVSINLNIAVEIPQGYFGAVFARSGLATKEGLRPANCVGVVDSDYRGELKIMLHNDSDVTREVKKGQRVAQMVIIPYLQASIVETEELSDTDRGESGFGSTGKF